MSWADFLTNPKAQYLKKALFDLLQGRFQANEQIVERLAAVLVTDADFNAFMRLVADTYESGYIKAVDDHRAELEKLGFSVNIKTPQRPKAG